MTRQRRMIYDIIKTSHEHMTAEQIYRRAKAQMPSIAMGTVYRNLGLMSDCGEIARIEMPGQPDRFDKTVTPHHHCICVGCGCVSDIPVPDLTAQLESSVGMPVEGYDLTVRILCDGCRKARAH